MYRLLSLLFSLSSGMLAARLFKQLWKITRGDVDTPEATDRDRSWREVLVVAALQGMVLGLVKAAVARTGAQGVRKLTGRWPGDRR
ncbi:hypothetical protein DPM19_26410 [Actinomadura craniellae]|uniref:DUF4235 domain-containing protein n=1 Tax=Actinomadura craniellae TaxID=2231787 RepID=A0A365GZK2_9ACTN|nr:DUF4235 domain-containing protein [Actinomadura craniellae]RAY12251.1 hypothetical protein DPM19_26410 [Actinomadura craniellae]